LNRQRKTILHQRYQRDISLLIWSVEEEGNKEIDDDDEEEEESPKKFREDCHSPQQ